MKMHDGCVHKGLRYSVYLRGVSPNAAAVLIRNEDASQGSLDGFASIKQTEPDKLFGFPLGAPMKSLTEIVELGIAKVREFDAVVETFVPDDEAIEE